MKNVAPKARSFESDRPFTIAAIACSRIPKCRFLPPGVPGSTSPAPSNLSIVLFDGPRSAEPPRNHGMFCARTLSTCPDASRPARPFASAGEDRGGGVLGEDVEPLPRCVASGETLRIGGKDRQVVIPCRRKPAPLHRIDLAR